MRLNSPHLRNRWLLVCDAILLTAALGAGYAVRFEGWRWSPDVTRTALVSAAVLVPVQLALFWGLGLYRRLWRYAGAPDLERIVFAGFLAGLVTVPLATLGLPAAGLTPMRMPLSVAALAWVCAIAVPALPRWAERMRHRRYAWPPRRRRDDLRCVLIAGAGTTGAAIVREMRAKPELGSAPVGFVDEDVRKHGQRLDGVPVLGAFADLPVLIARHGIGEVVIAMPDASGAVVRGVVEAARAAGVRARTVPALHEILSGRKSVTALRDVEIHDLLRRAPVRTDLEQVRALATGETVLVTGAGGSIGSELCRQLAALDPARLVLLGHGENSIFATAQELRRRWPELPLTTVICDVRDRSRLRAVLQRWRPRAVFHAAAHKHVPLMEENVAEAVTGNVLGTQNVAELAHETGVAHLVLISSDKAVRPTNVMGATKRAAEQVVQEVAEATGRAYVSVRFGNVLGSRGSVVPIFLEQIQAGGPVTITHPEMRRYFMTIPEAVQLVLQAGAIGHGGEVFVLDMGEPVRIVDLATDLIRLSGLEVGTDVEIRFTGVRPGEKLSEELFLDAEHAVPTGHPKILRAKNGRLPPGLRTLRADLVAAALGAREDAHLRRLLRRLVPDFSQGATEPGPGHHASSHAGGITMGNVA